jgi:histidine triad (HIT) family protein
MDDCLFCKIVAGEIPSSRVYEDDKVIAFHDIDKKAPVHVLIIPKKHFTSLSETPEEDMGIFAHIMGVAKQLADELKLQEGFRIVVNTGRNGGQTVPHLHFHLLGGRPLAWPPG